MTYIILGLIIIAIIMYKSGLLEQVISGTGSKDQLSNDQSNKGKVNNDFKNAYYGTDSLVSKAELNLYRILNNISIELDCILFSKVRLADIVKVGKVENRQSYFNRIKSKHIDFVLCDKNSPKPLLCIELDDKSHNKSDRKARDKFVDDIIGIIGFKILHIKCSYSYNSQEMKRSIEKIIASQKRGA